MSNKVPHIKKFNPRTNPETNRTKANLVAAGLAASGNADQVAQGLIVAGAATAVATARSDNATKKLAAKNSTTVLKNKNKDLCTKANAAAVIVEQLHPNDPDYWRGEGWEPTMEVIPATSEATQPIHCSVTQGDSLGEADIHCDSVENADEYRVLVSKGAVADRDSYIDVTNHHESTSSSKMTVILPSDYCNVPINFIIVPSNSLGDGIESVPFGGGRRIQ